MKRLLLLFTICISSVSFGQVPSYVPTDSLVGSIRNVSSYETLLTLSKGRNICSCETMHLNTNAELNEGHA